MSRFRPGGEGGANLSSAKTIAANDAPSRASPSSDGARALRRPPLRRSHPRAEGAHPRESRGGVVQAPRRRPRRRVRDPRRAHAQLLPRGDVDVDLDPDPDPDPPRGGGHASHRAHHGRRSRGTRPTRLRATLAPPSAGTPSRPRARPRTTKSGAVAEIRRRSTPTRSS